MHLSPQKFAARFFFTRSIGFDVVLGFLLALLAVSPAVAASHTWSGAVNGLFSNPGNWSAGGVPAMGEVNLSLVFPASATRTVMTNDIGALTVNSMNFQGSNYVLRGASTITFGSSLINVLCNGTSNVIESTLNLPSGFFVSVGDNDVMAFHTLTGAGFLAKLGEGEVQLRGGANNSLSGGYTVNVGTLRLQKTGGATAVASDLTIVGNTNIGQYASVGLDGSEQIAGNVNVTIHPSGILSLNNKTNTINNLTVMSGTVWLGGLLRLNGDVHLSGTDNPFPTPDLEPQIDVDLEFIGASSTITVSNLTCDIGGNIVEYGTATTINKTGPGALALKGTANNYTGALNINQGRVIAEHSTALGTIAGHTTVASGATLELRGGINSSETISLTGLGADGLGALQAFSGAHALSGGITLTGDTGIGVNGSGNSLILSGAVGGTGGIRKLGDGTLTLSGFGNNGFSGASWVAGGRLNLSKSAGVRAIGSVTVTNGAQLHFTANEQMDNAGVLSLYSAAICNLTNRTETLGGLNLGRGLTLDTGTGALTLLGNVYVGPPYTTASGSTTIRGALSLGGATRRFHAPDSGLRFDCVISDGAGVGGLSLNGGGGALGFGNFHFIRTNTFNGLISGDYAGLFAHNPQSFGTTNAGIIGTNNCEIILFNNDLAVTGESLTSEQLVILYSTGTNAWNGPVLLANSNSILRFNPWVVGDTNALTVNGSISGPGGLVLGDNLYYAPAMTVRLTQSNSFGGTTVIAPGRLVIQHPHALGSPAQGTIITADGTLELELPNGAAVLNEPLTFDPLNYFNNAPPRLALAGAVSNSWTGPITTDVQPAHVSVPDFGGTLLLNATISGPGGIEKVGNGTLILGGTGPNTFLGEARATGGILRLQKPDGVPAVSNLTVNFPAYLEWGGSEQIADAATLTLGDTYGLMSSHNETITHLAMINGDSAVGATTGTLTLLGNIDVTGANAGLSVTTVLGPGTHQINGFPLGHLLSTKSIHETGGSAGLAIFDSDVTLEASNTFSGPLSLNNDAHLTVRHPSALGSTAQGVFTTNWGVLVLDLPPGGVMNPEPLTLCSSSNDLGFIYLTDNDTNTWTGPVTINGRGLLFAGPALSRMVLSGPMSGSGSFEANGGGTVVLTGSDANTFNGLKVHQSGTVRLAKPPGVPALGGNIIIDESNNHTARLVLDAADQFSPLTHVSIGTSGTFDLNGQQAAIRRLLGNGTVTGNGQLTISNPPAGFDTDYSGGFASTLIKQGAGNVTFSGAFSGDLIVEGGTFSRTCAGGAGQTVISPGAVVTSSGANFFNFGALSGSGTLHISGANNMVGGPLSPPASSTFSGSIIGTNTGATLTKLGSGDLTLTGPVSLVSTTLVVNGTLLVNTVMTNPVVVNSPGAGNFPTLGGTGTVGPVTLAGVGARIAPGATTNVPSYGTLTVASLTAGVGTGYRCEIGGTNAGVNLDQINATGAVTLSGGFAEFTAFGAGATSNRYAVVKSVSAVSGTFNGDPEGDTIIPAAGRSMVITYLTAAGKEITLIEQPGANLANLSISSIVQQVNGHITLTGTGNSGSTYLIEANTNLTTTNWITLGSVIGNWNGDISFTDTNAPNFPQRFYRFRLE